MRPRVAGESKANLDRPFSVVKVRKALWQMHSNKSPGPDGFPLFFFYKCWDVVSELVFDLCLRILNDNLDAFYVNQTLITLIPKVDNPTLVSQFRLISPCNMVYKIVAKCLAIKLSVFWKR